MLKEERITLRLPSSLRKSCEVAAKRAGMSTADWLRGVMVLAVNQGAFAPKPERRKKRGHT